MGETIRALADAQPADEPRSGGRGEAASKIAECDQELTQYRAAVDAGASPATVAVWIAETEAEKAHYEIGRRQVAKARERMTEREIKSIVDKLADIARVLADADADDKSEIFRRLGLKLTYHPVRRLVEARIKPDQHRFFESVRGARPTNWAWWRNCRDQVFCCWQCPVMAADRVIRWTTAVAVISVVAVAAAASYEHA
jgi:hypothetical protein